MRFRSFLTLAVSLTGSAIYAQPASKLTISVLGDTSIVRWQGAAGTKYRLERSSNLGASWDAIDAPTTVFAETNLLLTPAAFFRVANWVNAYPTDTASPATPGGFTVEAVSCDRVSLTWNAAVDSGASASGTAEYLIYRSGAFLRSVPHAAGAATLSADDTTVGAASDYSYQIAVMDRAGNVSSRSVKMSVTTPTCPCDSTILPASSTAFDGFGGSGSLTVSAAGTCAWRAIVNQLWIHTTSAGTGDGKVDYTVDPNTSTATRSCIITVNGQSVTVTQTGLACSYTLNATTASQGADAGSGSFGVTATPGCSWNALANASWIHTTSAGTGDGTVNFTVDANMGTTSRSGTITVNDQTFGLDQRGVTTTDGVVPTATFLSPNEGAVLSGRVTLQARVTDNTSLARADFYIDNVGQWTLVSSTPSSGLVSTNVSVLDTTTVPNGSHRLLCQAHDAAGNVTSALLDVSVSNFTPDPGNALWFSGAARPTSSGEAIGNAVQADPQGNLIVVGNFKGNVTFGTVNKSARGGSDIFIAKFAPGGNLIWVQTFGGLLDDSAVAVAVDAAGNILITGAFFGTSDFGGGPLTSADGPYGSDIFVAKYSSSGTHLWSKRLGGRLGSNAGVGIAVDSSGNAFVAGKFYGEADFGGGLILSRLGSVDGFVVKLAGQTGAYMWSRDFGGLDSDIVKGVAVDSLGDVVVVGQSYAGIDFGSGLVLNLGSSDLFMVKYAGADGRYLWSRAAGGSGPDAAEGVAVDTNRNVFVTGSYYGSMNLGGMSLTAPLEVGIYVAKYDSTGALQWVRNIGYETTGGAISVRGVTADSAGNAAIIGIASGGVNFGSGVATYGEADFFVAKYGPRGDYLWAKRSAGVGRCAGYGIATDRDRNVLSTGFIQGDVNVDSVSASSPSALIKSAFVLKVSP